MVMLLVLDDFHGTTTKLGLLSESRAAPASLCLGRMRDTTLEQHLVSGGELKPQRGFAFVLPLGHAEQSRVFEVVVDSPLVRRLGALLPVNLQCAVRESRES